MTFGSLSVVTQVEPNALTVPVEAVQFEEGSRKGVAFVVEGDSVARQREVEAGRVRGKQVRILSGLSAGEKVVTEGGWGLSDGMQVQLAAETGGAASR
ncbi:MAG: hypothetical protein ACE5KM_24730 [Planctomycetaceae bacterium]